MCPEICFWPLTASTTSEVNNDQTHVNTQNICNKFIEINFFVGCMVSQPNHLFQHLTTMSLNDKMIWQQLKLHKLCHPNNCIAWAGVLRHHVNCWINCLWLCDCYCYCLSQFLSFDLVFFEFLRRNSANYVQLAGINLDALEMNWSNFHPNYILHKPLKIAHNIFHNQDLIRSAPLWPSAYK